MSQKTLKSRLDRFIHSPPTEFLLILLILLSVILVIAEVALENRGQYYQQVYLAQNLLTGIFILELTIRYYTAYNKQRFFRHYWLDIIAVMPLFRPFRLLRVLRILRLLRVGILLNRNLNRVYSTVAVSLGVQIGVFLIVGLIVLVGALSIHLLEGRQNEDFKSVKDSLWWSFFTLVSGEPIGGEPQTDVGRLVTLMVVLGGLTMFAVFTGVVSAVMIQRLRTVMEVKYWELDELRDHIVICGWNRSGHLLIEEIQADPGLKHYLIVIVAEFIQTPERELKRVNLSQVYFYSGDYTTIDVLEMVGIHHASRAILLADAIHPRSDQDRDARTVLAALTIEKLRPGIYTCAQLLDGKNNAQLRVAGVEDVIVADELASHLIATSVRNWGSVDILSELLTVQRGNQIYKISVPQQWVGISFWESGQWLKEEFDSIAIAVERQIDGSRETLINPPKKELLMSGDRLVVIARRLPNIGKAIAFQSKKRRKSNQNSDSKDTI
ncbi:MULTISPECIES: ion transporter [unclassified Coleofasciculus]|uniref:ion transporter n=1 Tax=unclassified Coleofasciculus TaxID=2692782 RepID=UPI0018814CA7|nr:MULTISPECIES: ion transporter [unclassified Coleofasciculus]MBE9126375.1 ion transporter [Coleofasciculus sp. LEGE 07081]MBE9150028.1 ion transporter [Coleofasciculus sp. LEGE 07092]